MERRFFSGNTLEQAVLAAARFYKLEPQSVAYGLREKKHGFVNTRRRIVIEVDPLAPEKSAEQIAEAKQDAASRAEQERLDRQETVARQARRPRSGGGPRPRGGGRSDGRGPSNDRGHGAGPSSSAGPGVDHGNGRGRGHGGRGQNRGPGRGRPSGESWADLPVEDLVPFEGIEELAPQAAVEKAIEGLVALAGLELESTVEPTDEGFHVELSGTDSDLLLEEDGQLLFILEHLLARVARGYCGTGLVCSVDSDGYRADHEEDLRELAEEAAEDAREHQEAQELEAMNPADRRIVHLTLADDPTVVTKSHGHGFFKSVTVYPAQDPTT